MHGTIETIAFGGQGILRDNGYVVFIPFTAPGDEIQFELIHKKKKHGEGKLLHLINPSPLRTDPLCPYYGRCGGCQFQHLSYAAQLEVKRKFIEDALNRLALASISVAPLSHRKTSGPIANTSDLISVLSNTVYQQVTSGMTIITSFRWRNAPYLLIAMIPFWQICRNFYPTYEII